MSGYALVLRDEVVAVVQQDGEFDEGQHNASFTSSPENIPEGYQYIYYDTVIHDPDLRFKVGEIFTGELFEEKYPPTISALISRVEGKIHSKSIELIDSDFEYKGNVYQVKSTDMTNILQKLVDVALDENIENVHWITKDNETVLLTRNDFIELCKSIGARKEGIIFTRRQMKDSLVNMSREELMSYEVDYGLNL